jgi:hypothetical protein
VTARLGGGALVATPSTLRRRGDVKEGIDAIARRHRRDAIDATPSRDAEDWTLPRTVTTSMNVMPSTHLANAAPAAPPPSARTCARSGLIATSRPAPSTVGRTIIFSARTIETLAAAAAASSARSARRNALTGNCALNAEGALRNNSRPRHATIPRAAYPSATRPKSPNRSVAGGGTADVDRAASRSAKLPKFRDQFPNRSFRPTGLPSA